MWNRVKEWSEIYVSVVLLLLLVTCVNPFESMMPLFWSRTVVVLLIAIYCLYAGIIYREAGKDERERLHVAHAERIGFLVGIGLLILFLAFDAFEAEIEKSLVFVIGGMVLAKTISLLVLKYRN